jgi:putative solute:sodium symporter small subunit
MAENDKTQELPSEEPGGGPAGGAPTPPPPGGGAPASPPPPPPEPEKPLTSSSNSAEQMQKYWRLNIIIILSLLVIWALVSYVAGILFVEPLNNITIGQLPLGFWFAQQGSIYVFVVLIFVYAFAMDVLDKKFNVNE